jgi:hypothetical protein
MPSSHYQQPLSYDVRLPEEAQADALRLLDASRAVVNALLARLWPRLDEFGGKPSAPAWKQVVTMTDSPDPHGDRQFRCESETAGRILRAQASRKQIFALIQPILSDGFIRPKEDKRPAGRHRKQITEAIKTLQNTLLTASVLQHNSSDPEHPIQISRPLFLNTGGLDGHQARTRRQIDQLKAARDRLEALDPGRARYEEEIQRCWRLYEARNRELAHLAANLLLLFASVWGCSLICGERLSTLKSTGRGRGVRGRWRNWRNNTQIRADIWHILRYKCHLLGIRFRSEIPDGTSHTCPHCGHPARTYRSPRQEHRAKPVKWGRWLSCAHCGFNADRDYCAALNIGRLGIAYVTLMQDSGIGRAFSVTEIVSVKPCPYMAHGAVPLFPPHTDPHRLMDSGKLYVNGWKKSVTLRSSYATTLLLRLCS